MRLIRSTLEKARRSRDARFDGRFFVGVVTTGVYCRPVCPAPAPKEENVRYFPSAAAAGEAGFRPCLRCRPETSPGTPAWLGSSATVSRALRLIADSALDQSGVEHLAERLGVGARHLRRLFLKHLGASPLAVAQTRRLHFAKRLIDETDLPMTQIAFTSGFGSIRRFNAVFKKLFARTPRELRQRAGRGRRSEPERYQFRLAFRPPLDWEALLEFLSGRAIPGVEAVSGGCYRRVIAFGGQTGEIRAALAHGAVLLDVRFPDPRALFAIIERARRLFDLGADPREIDVQLRRDPLLAALVRRHPGLRVPGAWDGFELAVRAILGQQVSVRGASTLACRIARAYGERVAAEGELTHAFPSPSTLARADLAEIGLTRARREALRNLARAVQRGELSLVASPDQQGTVERLMRLPGIGPWTAEYIAMRALAEPDAFPAGDLALARATGLAKAGDVVRRAEAWRPWRAYAAMYLWQGVRDDAVRNLHRDQEPGRTAAARGRP